MKEAGIVGGMADATAGARQRTHVARAQWEESWIAQQRNVTAVVVHEAAASTGMANPQAQPSIAAKQSASQDALAERKRGRDVLPADAGALKSHEGTQKIFEAVRRTNAASFTAPGTPAPVRIPGHMASEASHAESARVWHEKRDGLRQFAFWREGVLLDVAMRLRDPARDADSIMAQLRHWLREGGMHLRKVFINGKAVLREQPDASAPSTNARGSRLNRQI